MTVTKFVVGVVTVIAISLVDLKSASAQYVWDMSSLTAAGTITNLSSSPILGRTNGGATAILDTTSPSNTYSGFSAGNNAQSSTQSGAFNVGTSTYFDFTITPASGFAVQLNNISFGSRSTASGPTQLSVRSSVDNYASDIASYAVSANSVWSLQGLTSLSSIGAVDTAVNVRIYGSAGTGGTLNWRIDDLSVAGAAVAIPEPGSLAVLSLSLLPGAALLRRRRNK